MKAITSHSAPDADSADALETRRRLLEAAGEVFAEQGFRAATVREICRRAGANVAAVNYHFGDKERLYAELMKYAHSCAADRRPIDGGAKKLRPEEQLKMFIRQFLSRIFDSGRPAWHGKLMSREMIEPTAALDALVEQHIRPTRDLLMKIIREIVGPGAPGGAIRRCAFSVIGQIMFYHHARVVIDRLEPDEPRDLDAIARHVTTFSLAALKGLRHKGRG